MECGGEWMALLPVVEAGDEPPAVGLHKRKSWAFGVAVRWRALCDVTVDEHFDVRRFLKFILFLLSFLFSGDFCTTLSSGGPFGFISFDVGAIVISGRGDFLACTFWGSVFSGFAFAAKLSCAGDPDLSDVGDTDRLLQFLSQSSGVMRLEEDEALTR
jgi:hypothetical protein